MRGVVQFDSRTGDSLVSRYHILNFRANSGAGAQYTEVSGGEAHRGQAWGRFLKL